MQEKEIFTTKPFLPPIDSYMNYIRCAYEQGTLTNHGLLLQDFESNLRRYLQVSDIQVVTSATTALQMAIKALELEGGEIITTPFSYVATTTSIIAEKCKPVYVDIEPNNFTIDADKIEEAITPETKAIMPVHIFGYACNIEKIDEIAKKYNLKVIYDAAHAFGARYKGQSILNYGDVSVLSFQEIKLVNSAEGGALITADKYLSEQFDLIKKCGHIDDNYIRDGINARMSELHAGMGLACLEYIDQIIEKRKQLSECYDGYLEGKVQLPQKQKDLEYKYPYYTAVFKTKEEMEKVRDALCQNGIYPWHCYYPTLNTLRYLKQYYSCPVAEDICSRILMMPLYYELEFQDIERICDIVIKNLN